MITTNLSLTFFNTSGTPVTTANIPVELDTEYHVALVGQSGNVKVWVNGVESGSITFPAGITFSNDTLTFNAARVDSTTGVPVSVCDYSVIDEVKMYKNLAKYTTGNTYPQAGVSQSGTNSFNALSLLEAKYPAITLGFLLGWAISAEAEFEVLQPISWNITGQDIFLETNFDISWEVIGSIHATMDISWDLSTFETTLPISWEIATIHSLTHPLSWDLQSSLTKSLVLGYGIGDNYLVTSSTPISWDIIIETQVSLPVSWDLVDPISQTDSISWEISEPLSKSLEIINFINLELTSSLPISSDIMSPISKAMDLKYNIETL